MTSLVILQKEDILEAVREKYQREFRIEKSQIRVRHTGSQTDPTQHIEVVLEVQTIPVRPDGGR